MKKRDYAHMIFYELNMRRTNTRKYNINIKLMLIVNESDLIKITKT